MQFFERLEKARKALGLTQKAIAEKIGIQQAQYGRYETGATEPKINLLVDLSQLFNLNPDWLITGNGPMLRQSSPEPGIGLVAPEVAGLAAEYVYQWLQEKKKVWPPERVGRLVRAVCEEIATLNPEEAKGRFASMINVLDAMGSD